VDELTITECSKQLCLSRSAVKNWIRTGKIKSRIAVIKGRQTRLIPTSEIDRIKDEQHQVTITPGFPEQAVDEPDYLDRTNQVGLISSDLINHIRKSVELELRVKTLEDQLSNKQGEHWEPWRELIRMTGQAILNFIILLTTPKHERKRKH
jgi:hypothetical protein